MSIKRNAIIALAAAFAALTLAPLNANAGPHQVVIPSIHHGGGGNGILFGGVTDDGGGFSIKKGNVIPIPPRVDTQQDN